MARSVPADITSNALDAATTGRLAPGTVVADVLSDPNALRALGRTIVVVEAIQGITSANYGWELYQDGMYWEAGGVWLDGLIGVAAPVFLTPVGGALVATGCGMLSCGTQLVTGIRWIVEGR